MKDKLKNVLAICIGVLPFNIFMIWYRLTHTQGFTTFDMLVYPLVFGGGNILLILALNRYLLKKKINDFNPGKGKWQWDIGIGAGLTVIYFAVNFIVQAIFLRLLPHGKPPSQEVLDMMIDLARHPLLLAIWLGPVVWIGVALFEEVARVFMLNCLWRLSRNKSWEFFSIFLVSAIVGMTHLYQGAFGIVSIGIQGLVIGIYYYKFRRIWPLVVSHALYDSFQIVMFVIQSSR